uniref:Uncharacterized protein n=1 Tax=Hyaloperonospora arabidopsidis (strain Emoy2) TaxID=559515 RepID=M4BCH8_HYAAE
MKIKAHSGLQLQVLALYKKALQAVMRKDVDTLQYVRERFREDVRHWCCEPKEFCPDRVHVAQRRARCQATGRNEVGALC